MSMIEDKIVHLVLNEYKKILSSLEKKTPDYPDTGNPPTSIIVRQIGQHKPEGMCLGEAIAVWRVSERSIEKLSNLSIKTDKEPIDGMYYKEGDADFSISSDSKKVIIEGQVGPRYGRGWRYDIIVEDSNVTISKEADLWTS